MSKQSQPKVIYLDKNHIESMRKDPVFIQINNDMKKNKEKKSKLIIKILKKFYDTKDPNYLQMTTFRHIYNYKKDGSKEERFDIALGDFGYTIEELDENNLDDILNEIINRE